MQRRPDQDLFEQHCQHFVLIDPVLEAFCSERGFTLEKNGFREPCRIIRKGGTPSYFLDIFEEVTWRSMTFDERTPHGVLAAAHYSPADHNEWVYRLEYSLAKDKSFEYIRDNLKDYLVEWLTLTNTWTTKHILKQGEKQRNLATIYMKPPWIPPFSGEF